MRRAMAKQWDKCIKMRYVGAGWRLQCKTHQKCASSSTPLSYRAPRRSLAASDHRPAGRCAPPCSSSGRRAARRRSAFSGAGVVDAAGSAINALKCTRSEPDGDRSAKRTKKCALSSTALGHRAPRTVHWRPAITGRPGDALHSAVVVAAAPPDAAQRSAMAGAADAAIAMNAIKCTLNQSRIVTQLRNASKCALSGTASSHVAIA